METINRLLTTTNIEKNTELSKKGRMEEMAAVAVESSPIVISEEIQEKITDVIFLTQSEDDNEQGVMEKDENTRGGKRAKKPSLIKKE